LRRSFANNNKGGSLLIYNSAWWTVQNPPLFALHCAQITNDMLCNRHSNKKNRAKLIKLRIKHNSKTMKSTFMWSINKVYFLTLETWVLSEQIFRVMGGGVFEKSAFCLGQNGPSRQESNLSVSCLLLWYSQFIE
jgi:hypothetical protein